MGLEMDNACTRCGARFPSGLLCPQCLTTGIAIPRAASGQRPAQPIAERIRSRIVGRADQSARNAEAIEASGYKAEALLQRAKADAYRVAAEDVADLFAEAERAP